ncbi:MAG: hypothetical protein LBJ96_01040 [Holosporaceae bacterium]|jgi:hypothetical protein|nr:hypothetical protein [Holosporaceae bacterium]
MKKHLAAFTFLLGFFDLGAMQCPPPDICDRFHGKFVELEKERSRLEKERLRLNAEYERLSQKKKALDDQEKRLYEGMRKIPEIAKTLTDQRKLFQSHPRNLAYFLKEYPDCQISLEDIQKGEKEIFDPFIVILDEKFPKDKRWQFFKSRFFSHGSGLDPFSVGYGLPNSDQIIYLRDIVKDYPDICNKLEKVRDELRHELQPLHGEVIEKMDRYLGNNNREWNMFKWSVMMGENIYLISGYSIGYRAINPSYMTILQGLPQSLLLLEELQAYAREWDQYEYDDCKKPFDRKIFGDKAGLFNKLCLEKREEAVLELSGPVSDEIYGKSRPPQSDHEISAANKFVKMLGDFRINEVRFIDAGTLISTTNIPEARKSELLDALHQESETDVQREISKLTEGSSFENDNLKERVTQDLRQAASCPVYRGIILALIAWTEATSSTICEGISFNLREHPVRKLVFKAHNGANCLFGYSEICLNYSLQLLTESFFDSSGALAQDSSHLSLRNMPIGEALLHEAGHIISWYMARAADIILKLDSISMEVASRSVIVEELPDAVSDNIEFIKKELNDENSSYWKGARVFQGEEVVFSEKAREEWSRVMVDQLQTQTPPAVRAKESFDDLIELFQILGFFTASHSGSNVLYINLLSDAAYYIEKGLPVRCSHQAKVKSAKSLLSPEEIADYRREKYFARWENEHLKPTYTLSMNPEFYDALIEAYGSEMSEYKERLKSHGGPLGSGS